MSSATRRSFLALGDSYTIGEGVDAKDRWPAQLVRQLRTQGISVSDPTIVARTGWTTDELLAAIDPAHLAPPYDLVTLLIGVNDQYRGGSAADYRPRFRELLDRAVQLAGGNPRHVIVLSIPDWSVTPFAAGRDRAAIGRAIEAFNAVNREEANGRGARRVDITESSRAADRDPCLVAGDGLHPSAEMYEQWAGLVRAAAAEVLAPQIR